MVAIDGKNCIRIAVPKGNAVIDCDGAFYRFISSDMASIIEKE